MQTDGPLTCPAVDALATDYLEDALHWADRARLETHLARCPRCTARLAALRETIRTLARLPRPTIRPAARRACLALFRAWQRQAIDVAT